MSEETTKAMPGFTLEWPHGRPDDAAEFEDFLLARMAERHAEINEAITREMLGDGPPPDPNPEREAVRRAYREMMGLPPRPAD